MSFAVEGGDMGRSMSIEVGCGRLMVDGSVVSARRTPKSRLSILYAPHGVGPRLLDSPYLI